MVLFKSCTLYVAVLKTRKGTPVRIAGSTVLFSDSVAHGSCPAATLLELLSASARAGVVPACLGA